LAIDSTMNLHRVGEWVAYLPGDFEQVIYTSKTTGSTERLNFDSPIVLANSHLVGEPVAASRVTAMPSRLGKDFPFYLPSTWVDRLKFIFDLARAAGVEVVTVSDR